MRSIQLLVEETDTTYTVLIGTDRYENDQIIKDSDQNDTWFHLNNMSGPHIILKNNGDKIPKRYLNQIAVLFKQFKSNLPNNYNVIYTTVKNVKLTKVPGQVTVTNTKTIKI
jgi:predicted ribosome quality control (RQC) complex YloA/Tae2 family protein